MLLAIDNGFQACLMHNWNFSRSNILVGIKALVGSLGINIALLTGFGKKISEKAYSTSN